MYISSITFLNFQQRKITVQSLDSLFSFKLCNKNQGKFFSPYNRFDSRYHIWNRWDFTVHLFIIREIDHMQVSANANLVKAFNSFKYKYDTIFFNKFIKTFFSRPSKSICLNASIVPEYLYIVAPAVSPRQHDALSSGRCVMILIVNWATVKYKNG